MARDPGNGAARAVPAQAGAAAPANAPAARVRSCAACGESDDHPRHYVSGARFARQTVQMPDGTPMPIDAPVDEFFHHDCHAKMGCDHCKELCDANGGHLRIPSEQIKVPAHLRHIEPYEFEHNEYGALRRVRSKAEAVQMREANEAARGITSVRDAEEANRLHEAHAALRTEGAIPAHTTDDPPAEHADLVAQRQAATPTQEG